MWTVVRYVAGGLLVAAWWFLGMANQTDWVIWRVALAYFCLAFGVTLLLGPMIERWKARREASLVARGLRVDRSPNEDASDRADSGS
jgi:hypothetical protein